MTRLRLVIAHAAIALVAGGSLGAIARNAVVWPFSRYPMFAGIDRGGPIESVRLYGVTESGEVLLQGDAVAPFGTDRLVRALTVVTGDPPRLRRALGDELARYEARRRAGRHAGPPLRAIRLYLERWTRDPEARNVGAPDARKVLAEVAGGS